MIGKRGRIHIFETYGIECQVRTDETVIVAKNNAIAEIADGTVVSDSPPNGREL